jgi:hypothetical protein
MLDLRSGKRDKYLYALTHWGEALVFLLLFVWGAISYEVGRRWGYGALALITFILFMEGLSRVVLTTERLANFEDYRAELLRRWPDLNLPEATGLIETPCERTS